jgi:Astacin (Peptidase family M12A)
VQWNEKTTQTTYVLITLSGTGGQGDVNTIGYPSSPGQIALNCNTDCSVTTLLHEMGHIVGLRHEMVRTDRDSWVTVNYNNVIRGTWVPDFAIDTQNQQLLTPYDYASVMEYPSFVDSSNGGPVIETIPAGIPLQGVEGLPGAGNQDYSAADKEAIERLYGKAPTTVTVTSNPVGLQVLVDSQLVTTPRTYNWALNSTHTLSVPSGVQTLTGDIENNTVATTFYYTYGRWNDSTAQTHTITVNPGNGSPAFPGSSPQIATYSANFIQLVPYTETVTPSGDGTVSVSPPPQTYSGASDSFFVARQNVTMTATPNSGVNFYEFNAQAPFFWLPGGLSANPKEFYVPDTGNPVAVSAEFTTYPVYTVNVAPPAGDNLQNVFSDNLWAYIDGAYWPTPRNFSNDPAYSYDTVTSWAAGTSHTLNVNFGNPEYPYSFNSRFAFSSWSDGGAEQHTITSLPTVSTTYTATVTPQYLPATNFGYLPCGGTAVINTTSPTGDGFYPWGTQLSFQATADSGAGWSFGGWTYDLTGNANPGQLTADGETLVYVNFNASTASAPLTLTSLSPASVTAGSAAFTLTLTGTGFSSDSHVYIGSNAATSVDVVSPTEIQVPVSASWVASPAAFDVSVENFPVGWSENCAAWGYDTFTVTGALSTPTITWTPAPAIILGSAGSTVLNAAASAPGTFTYSATPTSGGSAVDVTSGTTGLTANSYNITATFTPTDPAVYTSAQTTKTVIVSGESLWILNSSGGTSELAGTGNAISSTAYSGANQDIAIDNGGNIWSVGTGTPLLVEINQVGSTLTTIPSATGGLNAPVSLAIDGGGQVWLTNGNNTLSLFSNAGVALSPSTGFTDSSLNTPSGIAVDLGGSVWISNKSGNSVTRVLGAAAPAAPLSTAIKNNTLGARP